MVEGVSIATGLNPLTDPVSLLIVQILLIVIVSRILGYLLSYLKQPPVISEVITGILLGPSVLGRSPDFKLNVFPDGTATTVLNVFANIGLIFFMFMIGLEVDATILRKNLKASMIISLTSIVVPFAMGIGLAAILYQYIPFHEPAPGHPYHLNFGLFCVFVGVAISITAFPVLARILNERNLMQSRVGTSSIAAASVDDVIAWILLAVVVSWGNNIKSGSEEGVNLSALWTFLMLIGFVIFIGTAVRIGFNYSYKRFVKTETHKHHMMVITLVLALAAAFYTQVIGVHAIFGAFLLGIVVPRIDSFHIHVTEKIEDLVTIIMLPLYFTYSGLRTNLSSIDSGAAGGLTILIIFIACLGKMGGATIAAKFTKKSWRESFTIGVLMNTKGLVELIVLNIGLDIGVLDQTTFTMFVIMALVTTFMTTPIVHYVWTVWEDKQGRVPMKPREVGRFNILLYISGTKIGSAMTYIAGAILPSQEDANKKKYVVKSLFLHPASDRPSSYFFNFSKNYKNLPPQKREVVEAIESDSNQVGLKFKPIFINSTDAAQDITTIAKRQWPDIVLMGYSSREENNSIAPIGAEDQAFYGKVILKVLQTCKSCIGVVVDKGLERFHKQHNVLFAYTGESFEADALTIVKKMSRRTNITVTVLTNQPDNFLEKVGADTKSSNFNVVPSNDPHRELIEKSSNPDSEYWMVVVGVTREDATKQEKLINSTQLSLLIVHPSNTLLDPSLKSSSSFANLSNANGNEYQKSLDDYDNMYDNNDGGDAIPMDNHIAKE